MENQEMCKQKIAIVLTSDQDGIKEDERVILLDCCLYSPHPEWKHQNPRIQRSMDGDKRTTNKEWSFYMERVK